ncbi:MAG: hypothetical protein OIN86_15040 [Candidatus Methanoperedens sp.]|nr:hypothetical protein [Candidatus Methanoperedens sp.]CAG0973785.1 hypothetical protein METP1_01392 [Methanosarcinales archaeon]
MEITSTKGTSGITSHIFVVVLGEPVQVVPSLFSVFIGNVGITNTKGISGATSHLVVIVLSEQVQGIPGLFLIFKNKRAYLQINTTILS